MAANGRTKRQRQRSEPKLVRLGPVDNHVGGRVKLRRRMLGLSQQKLAGSLGVTFQQVQKYENGVNRLPINRLIEFCEALSVPASQVLDGLSTARQLKGPTTAPSAASGSRMHGIRSTRRGRQ